MNPLTPNFKLGCHGELLVQLRLLEFGVQAAPPVEDSGNDLIAIRGDVFRAVSVRSTTVATYTRPKQARIYHYLAVVKYTWPSAGMVKLDEAAIYLIPRCKVWTCSNRISAIRQFLLCEELLENAFSERSPHPLSEVP
jgi:hypothetical protein